MSLDRKIRHNGVVVKPPLEKALSAANLSSQEWRLDNLYWIVNEEGELVQFRLRPAQRKFLRRMWYRNIVLKARQLGFSTLIEIWQLDCCLFVPNTKAVIIAHKREDASTLLETKVNVPYANLHPSIQERVKLKSKNKSLIEFSNGSSISVTTSGRSGTVRLLHISEMGYIAKHRPDVAEEIVLGSFPAVHDGGFINVESTADGATGLFFDMAMKALGKQRSGAHLTEKDFRVHFFPWFDQESYRLSDEDTRLVKIPERLVTYFESLRLEHGIRLSPAQKAWYAVQEDLLEWAMKQEYPSTPEEAFESSGEGQYFLRPMTKAREDGRLMQELPVQPGRLVHVYWDVGVSDPAACWFIQHVGAWFHVLGYYEETDLGMDSHIPNVKKIAAENGWVLPDKWYGPHDMKQRSKGTALTLAKECEKYGATFEVVPRVPAKNVSIQAARRLIAACRFCTTGPNMELGISRLDGYRKEWKKITGVWGDKPLHDENSDGADAFQTFAMAIEGLDIEAAKRQRAQPDPRKELPEGGPERFRAGMGPAAARGKKFKGFTV